MDPIRTEEIGQHLEDGSPSLEPPADEGSNNDFETIDPEECGDSVPTNRPNDAQQLIDSIGPAEDGGFLEQPIETSPLPPQNEPAQLLDLGPSPAEPAPQPAAEKKEPFVQPPTPEPVARPNKGTDSCPGLGWLSLNNMDKRVCELLLWKKPIYSGVSLAMCLIILLTLACYSIISVMCYLTLLTMTATLSLHIYSYIYTKVMDSQYVPILSEYMDVEVSVPVHKLETLVSEFLHLVNVILPDLRDLLLFKEILKSVKFALIVYACSYIGACFNGLTLLTLGVAGAFTLPYIYRVNQNKIDSYLNDIRTQITQLIEQMQDKIPFLKLKSD